MTNLLHPLDLAINLELNNEGLWLGHTQPALFLPFDAKLGIQQNSIFQFDSLL